ncbi:hypothetical protein ABZY02_33820 [Streptomyces sp. NPDC006649]|uniref:hypothetical protein n=1 Tax=Streptomyces sp. NPDC006649 TaxID=3156896 RepID=UPI0033A67BE1
MSHAVYCGMPAVVDVLIRAGAVPQGLVDRAGVGLVTDGVLRAGAHGDLVRDADHDMTASQWYLFRRGQLADMGNPDCWKNAARIEQLLAGAE